MYQTSLGQKKIMAFIGQTAMQVDRKLTALEGAIQANSYFESIALDLPTFLEKFNEALDEDSEFAKRVFSDYLGSHKHDLYKSKRALYFALKGGFTLVHVHASFRGGSRIFFVDMTFKGQLED